MATELKMTMTRNYDCKNSVRFDNVKGNMGAINASYIRNQDLEAAGMMDAQVLEIIVRKVR